MMDFEDRSRMNSLARGFYEILDDEWVCKCGTVNYDKKCTECGKKKKKKKKKKK